ncbi:MAG TPA: DUF1501 domain-containing protein, partial [Pirellulales bacterium]
MSNPLSHRGLNRREFLSIGAAAAGTLALPGLGSAASPDPLRGRAEHVVSIWLGGGMGQIDTFDPKRMGDPTKKLAGSYYKSIDTAVSGVQVCEHLEKTAPLMDRATAVRTVHHGVIDEHAAATNFMHTGRPISGTVAYPSLGSIIAHERGAAAEGAPAYVLIGYPNVTRGPGFLGARAGYLYLTDTSEGPAGLSRPEGIDSTRQSRRESLLGALRRSAPATTDSRLLDYDAAIEQSLELSGPEFQNVFKLDEEPADLRNQYGGEFGQRCLLSRRLVERG